MQPRLFGPRLSRTSIIRTQKIHYHACAEGVANELLWVWSQVERQATDSVDLPWTKLTDLSYFLSTAGHDHAV